MQFSEANWEIIRKMKMGNVTWELLPPVKTVNIIDYNKVKPLEPLEPISINQIRIDPVKEPVKRTPKVKDESPKTRQKRKPKK